MTTAKQKRITEALQKTTTKREAMLLNKAWWREEFKKLKYSPLRKDKG